MKNTVRLDPADNVVTAIRPLEAGAVVEDTVTTGLIPRGHKMAAEAIPRGTPIRKYAQVIGYAGEDIAKGAHVHTHNVEFRKVGEKFEFATDNEGCNTAEFLENAEVEYEFSTNLRPAPRAETRDTFMGYRRATGRVGTRNYIAVLTSVNCSSMRRPRGR